MNNFLNFCQKASVPLARFAIFLVYFWFGFLKILDLSPASPLVKNLFEHTIPIMNFGTFFIIFGIFECLIGLLFLFPRFDKIALPVLGIHLITTFLPLILLPHITWNGFLAPTLEGQYIIKNILIIAAAVTIGAQLRAAEAKS